MRWPLVCFLVAMTSAVTIADEPSTGVQDYLHRGDLANGELELQSKLERHPDDDQTRFALGMLQMARAVERLGQSLYFYGIRSEFASSPVLRLPVPENPDPSPITYIAFRRLFDDFYRDLATVEETLSKIKDDNVRLPLKLAAIHLDLTADGEPSERFEDVLKRILRSDLAFLAENQEFLVQFDRGDAAWMQAYCHLMMAVIDVYLSFDTQQFFNAMAERQFPKVIATHAGNPDNGNVIVKITEKRRLARFRRHMIEVVRLNHDTWKYIRAETDDDHEWLPNAKQERGVLGLPVQDEMIDAWLAMVDEFKALLDGDRTLFKAFWGHAGKGLDLHQLLENPPSTLTIDLEFFKELPEQYFSDAQEINLGVFLRVSSMMQNTTGVGYAAWFN